jgi:hypothetical protein
MKSPRTLFALGARGLFVVSILLLLPATAHADTAEGKITQDITIGANHDIPLKTGQVVQIMNQNGAKTVIMLPLADGSNGIFQIDSADIQSVPAGTPLGLPAPPPPPPPAPGTVPPSYPAGFVGVPTFQTTQGDHAAGLASIIKPATGDYYYIISARQLLGPLGGFSAQVAAKDVPSVVQNIQLARLSGGSASYAVTPLAVPTKRLQADGGKPIDDLAIYRLPDTAAQAQAVPLATQAPAVGDIVWLIARLRGSPADQLGHRGQVTDVTPWLMVQFDNNNIITSGAAGAPVLNATGEVVGIFSSSLTGGGQVRGYVIPAALIAQTIQKQKH